jgi:hypothetical protein
MCCANATLMLNLVHNAIHIKILIIEGVALITHLEMMLVTSHALG